MSEWRQRAACRGFDPNIFFSKSTRLAKAICADCPVKRPCYDEAQTPTAEGPFGEHGVWGNTTGLDRERHRRDEATEGRKGVGDGQFEIQERSRRVVDLLGAFGTGVTVDELADEWIRLRQETRSRSRRGIRESLGNCLRTLEERGKVTHTGSGNKGQPFRYHLRDAAYAA